MNWGYASLSSDGVLIHNLAHEDENERFSVQLYHYVATGIDNFWLESYCIDKRWKAGKIWKAKQYWKSVQVEEEAWIIFQDISKLNDVLEWIFLQFKLNTAKRFTKKTPN